MMIHAASEKPKDDLTYEDMSEVLAPHHTHKISHRRQSISIITFGVCLCVTQGEKIVYEYFSDPEFIDQLVEFLSLEDRKGNDSFNPRRFCLFKVQFKLAASIDLANLLTEK